MFNLANGPQSKCYSYVQGIKGQYAQKMKGNYIKEPTKIESQQRSGHSKKKIIDGFSRAENYKTNIENSLDRFNSRSEMTEERV